MTSGSSALAYDPAIRLYHVTGATTTRFAYDGLDRIAEYDGSNALLRRYVQGPGDDEPIVWYEGTDTSNRRFLSADERGSIISVSDGSGALLGINSYDEYGNPAATNLGVFGYTGQAWLSDLGEYYYKARVYDPELGRFLQPDPIGYADSPNLYNYVLGDPLNNRDPLGLETLQVCHTVLASAGGSPLGNPMTLCSYYNITDNYLRGGPNGPGEGPEGPKGGAILLAYANCRLRFRQRYHH
jgi:RHS repeat-associated protein